MSAPFGRRVGVVSGREDVGAYVVLRVRDGGAPSPRAGQFYMLAAVSGWGGGDRERPFLPRACSILDFAGEELSFMLENVGPGTAQLCALGAGAEVWLSGPFGNGFAINGEGNPVLVGGGVGVAPLALLQKELGGAPALLGFRDEAHAAGAALMDDVELSTDDGSRGMHGNAVTLLARWLEGQGGNAPAVFACGPPAMLEALRALCAMRGVAAQLALESPMACGFGACYGCVVATVDGYKRVCVDGPVFDAAVLEVVT